MNNNNNNNNNDNNNYNNYNNNNYNNYNNNGGLGSWLTGRDYPNDTITENGQNTEKSPGELRRLAVTQTPVKNNQLILMWKTLKE